MQRRQPQKSSAAFCVKSASCPPTELLLSPGLVIPVLGQVFGECGRKSTCGHARGALAATEMRCHAGEGVRAHQLKSDRERAEVAGHEWSGHLDRKRPQRQQQL